MARRQRSYGKNKPVIGTLINNVLANKQKNKGQQERAQIQEKNRKQRQYVSEQRQYAREQDRKDSQRKIEIARNAREQDRNERQRENERRRLEKEDQKYQKLSGRAELELEKLELYPGTGTVSYIADAAVKGSLTVSQIKAYLIAGNELDLQMRSARELMDDKHIVNRELVDALFGTEEKWGEDTVAGEIYAATLKVITYVSTFKPQIDVLQDEVFCHLLDRFHASSKQFFEFRDRQIQRQKHIECLRSEKSMFSDDLAEYIDIIEEKDWEVEFAENSDEYKCYISNKATYVLEIRSQLAPICLNQFE